MSFLRFIVAACLAVVAFAVVPSTQSQAAYTLINADGRRPLPFRSSGTTELVPLADVASLFGLTLSEDAATGGLLVTSRGPVIVLTANQSLVSVGGRIVALSGSVARDGRSWFVPVDFLSRVLAQALNLRIDVRRNTRVIVVGNVRVPQVSVRLDRQGGNGVLQFDVQPGTPHRVTREASRITVRFDADGLDVPPMSGNIPDFVTSLRAEGPSVIVDLGSSAANVHVSDERDLSHFSIDLLAPGAAIPTPAPTAPEAPVIDRAPPGTVRTVVIDPGHGGADEGVHGPGGTIEKDLALGIARRLKAAIESRIGLHTVLTRDSDELVPMDRRTAIANNSQADLLFSLHANASVRPAAHGAQVLSLNLDDYKSLSVRGGRAEPVPIIGGGTRLIETVPWDFAQLRHATASAALATILVHHFTASGVPLYSRPVDAAPLRVLASSNTPAILIELGFLTNPDDERALSGPTVSTAIINAIVDTILDVRAGIPTAGRETGGQQ